MFIYPVLGDKTPSQLDRFKIHEAFDEFFKGADLDPKERLYPTFNKTSKGQWLLETLHKVITESAEYKHVAYDDFNYVRRDGIYRHLMRNLALYNLDLSADNPSMINYWPSYVKATAAKHEVSKKTKTKQGKAIRKVIPGITDAELEEVVDAWRDTFCADTSDLRVIVGSRPEDYKKAYAGQISQSINMSTTSMRKSIASSCMRHGFEHIKPYHPAEMYATEDFNIIYIVNPDDEICGRQLVCKKTMAMGPAYGVSEITIDMLMNKATELGYSESERSFEGAKLQRLESNHGDLIGSYLDFEPQCARDCGDHLIIDYDGDVCCESYSGTLSMGSNHYCDACGDGVHEDDIRYSDHGDCYCSYCYEERYFTCEYSGEEAYRDEAVTVYCYYGPRNRTDTELWSDESASNHAVLAVDGEYWKLEDTTLCDFDGEFIPNQALDGHDYFTCDMTGDIFPITERVSVADVGDCAIDSVNEDGGYTFNETTDEWEIADEQAA